VGERSCGTCRDQPAHCPRGRRPRRSAAPYVGRLRHPRLRPRTGRQIRQPAVLAAINRRELATQPARPRNPNRPERNMITMAKMKTYAVEVEVTTKHVLFIEARRPNGAAERLLTEDGWNEAIAWRDEDWLQFQRRNAKVVRVREADT
jgi:hypothetical protein